MRIAMVVFALVAVSIFVIIFIALANRKKEEEEVKDVIAAMSFGEDKSSFKMMAFEALLVAKLNLPKSRARIFVYALRVLLIALIVVAYLALGIIGIAIAASALILMIMEKKKQKAIEDSGVTHISETVSFMDYFVPQLSSGTSASQAFGSYIQKLSDDNPLKPLFVEYWDAKMNGDYTYETPERIRDIASVYEIALYNEEMGSEDYLYIIEEAKTDLFTKSTYYADYNSKVGEVLTPIQSAYYIGVPVIIILLLGSVGDFWYTIPGFVTAIVLVILFFAFKALCNRLAIKTIQAIL